MMPLSLGTGEDEQRSLLRGLLLDQCCLQPCHHMPISAAQLQLQLKTREHLLCLLGDCLTPNHPKTHSCTICNGLQQVPGGTSTSYQGRRCLLLHSVAQYGETPHLFWRRSGEKASVKCPKEPQTANRILSSYPDLCSIREY